MNLIIMTAALALGTKLPALPEPKLPERAPIEAVLTEPLRLKEPEYTRR